MKQFHSLAMLLALLAGVMIGGTAIAAEHAGDAAESNSSSTHAGDAASHDKPSHEKSSEGAEHAGEKAESESSSEHAGEAAGDSSTDAEN